MDNYAKNYNLIENKYTVHHISEKNMKNRILIAGLFALFLTDIVQSQYLNISTDKTNKTFLTGNLQNDLVMQMNKTRDINGPYDIQSVNAKNKYSPLLAGLFSAVVPGAGQFYTKSYWQGAAFLGVEIISWIAYTKYEKKGDQQTEAFQNYADKHWSAIRYAYWIKANYPAYYNNMIVPGQQASNIANPWIYVSWDKLNGAEDSIAGDLNIQPTGFTHKLAPYSDQQYYEMIGKYSQFGGGWDDATSYTKSDVIANNGIGNVSPEFIAYSHMRGDANNFYNIATAVSYIIVANHVFSALEAAWNASKINHKIQLQGHIESRRIYGNLIEFDPTLQVKYEL